MTEEEKPVVEVSSEVLEAVFAEEVLLEEDTPTAAPFTDEDEDNGVDIAFLANDEGYW